jgi:hypothetical protein
VQELHFHDDDGASLASAIFYVEEKSAPQAKIFWAFNSGFIIKHF